MKITIATPCFGDVHPEFAHSLAATYRSYPDVTWKDLRGCADIVLARNDLLHRFRNGKDDLVVYIDADISWTLEDLALLLEPIKAGKAHVVAGVYQMKVPGPAQFVVDLLEEDCFESTGYTGPSMIELGGYYRASSTGFGFFAMTRHAVEKAAERCGSYCPVFGRSLTNSLDERQAFLFRGEIFFRGVQPDILRYRGEDTSACATIREAGFDIWCPRKSSLVHHAGQHAYGGRVDVDALAKRLALQNDVMRKGAAGTPVGNEELQRRLARLA